ncbi:hypothetical protein PHLCEN_2v11529 [Hermanssonia centrifuga]|uniref:Extracellular serine-rich protein n=1 Tax=Hermanssonia centrifuga TaxID=98765 RepID=A0A2R6NJQ0_9APHY|nr:hypothetical protein PHLCEN_2v11529 [Hermanssonia centrifuga]
MRAVSSIITVLSAAAVVVAQTTIQVGSTAAAAGGIFQFIPSNITAANGTTVTFMWSGAPGNHSVTQSSLDSPCQPLPNGFDSGFVFIPTPATSGIPSWNLTITNDQEPIYFYCGQLVPAPGHCPLGMVGTINAPTTGNASWEAFWETAMGTAATTPGTPIPNLSGVGANASAAPGPLTGSGVSGAGLPTASGASSAAPPSSSATSASTSPSPTTSASAAVLLSANGITAMIAVLFGIALM